MEEETEAQRGKWLTQVDTFGGRANTSISKSPDSKFKVFLLYPFKLLNRITLNQRSHAQMTTYYMIPLMSNF